uniref:DNA-directed DNA polymerase n=1 Tax=Tanacetum cinerariifolium TaxID=118510 RepID=A0A6L2LD43_TANCI|nr:DNA-directed DNA polymerase [Tanacetum cinerariifolium]
MDSNTIRIKLANGTWKVQTDNSSLNKVCAKDMYPLPKEGEELASFIGYPYKCFLRLPKEYNKIRMAKDDEKKIGFHTKEGVYCFTHMPKELKNFVATLHRMMENVLAYQRGRNEAEGPVVMKFFGQGEQVEETPNANKRGIFDLNRRKPYTRNRTRKKVQRGNYGCNGPIPQVSNHTSPKNLEPKSRSVDMAGNYKARIPQPGSIDSNPSSNPIPSTNPNPKGRNRRRSKQRIEEFNLDEISTPIVTMADQRMMAQLLQAPTEGYEDAIIVPAITADNFELKHVIIESKSKVRYSRNKPVVAKVSTNTSTFGISPDVAELKDTVKALLLDKKSQNQSLALVKAVDESCVTYRGAHSYRNCLATDGNVYRDNIQEFVSQASTVNYNQGNTSYRPSMIASTSSSRTVPSNTIANPRSDLKAITTRSEATNDTLNPTNNGSTEDVQPQVIQSESLVLTSEPVTSPISEPVIAPVSAPKPNPKTSIPYPSRRNDERNPEKANNQIEKFYQIFKDMSFKISFTDALILMPKFASTLKALIGNKEKLSEMARTLLNEHYSAVLLKKLLEKLGDPSKLSLPDLKPTCMTLKLADRSISRLVGVAEYVYVKTGRALIDVFEENYLPEVRRELKIYEAKSDKSSVDEPLEVELKDLLPHLEYAFLEGNDKLPVIIAKYLSVEEKTALITDFEPAVQHQRRVNPKIHDIIKQEAIKLLDAGLVYPISDSPWVSPVYCVPKKGGFTVVENEDNELILTRLVTGWHICIDYRMLNEATRKDHFPLPFMDQMLERLAGNQYYCFLDGFSGYFQIPIDSKDQEKTTFTCPYRTIAYRRMPFGLCNAPGTFQRMLKRCEDTNLCLNWEKSHFMVKEGIVLGHKITKQGIEVDKEKVDVITKLPHPTTIKVLGQRPDKHFRPIHYAMIDTKGAENLATDHLSRLENPHQNVLDPKEINESFPLETLNLISTRSNQNTPWFADFINYYAGNFVVKGMSSQQKSMYQARKPLKSSRLATIDPQEVTMAQITQPRRFLLFNSRLKIFSGKLKSRWSGPFTISQVYPYGTVELSQPDGPNFKVNGHRVKHCFGKDVPKLNGDQPLPVIAQVSLAGTAHNAPPTIKDLKFWTATEKKTRKIDRLARSLLIQGLPNDIYSLIDSNQTAKYLWDALERQMRGSGYGEQDRKAAILYEYETFKANEGEQLLDTYLRYLQVINDLKKCGYKKDNYELNYNFLNNLQLEWKQYGDVNDAFGYKKKVVVVTSDPLALVAEKTNMSKQKEKVVVSLDSEGSITDNFSELKKITALLAKAFNRRKFYSKPTNNNLRISSTSQSANKKQEFDKKEDKKADEKKRDITKVKCYNCNKEGHFAKDCKKEKIKDYNYYKTKMLLDKKYNDERVLLTEDQAWMESNSDSDKEINANMVFIAQIEKVLSESDESYSSTEETIAEQTSSLKPYVPNVILEKIIIDLEDEVVSLLEKEKQNLKTIESLKSKGFESSENVIYESENQSENDSHVIEKECDKVENPKVIAPGMFKLSMSQSVSPISVSKTSCESNNVESKLKRKRRKRKSSKQNVKQVNNDVSRANSDFVHFSYLDTFSSVRRLKHSSVIWKKKGSSNTSNVDLSSDSHLKLNKNVKRYSRKDLLACNNSHLGETSSASVYNDAMNVSCNYRMCDMFDDNNFFIFDDVSVRISPVSKMPFRKKPRDSMNVRSKSNSNKSLSRTMHNWLPKLQPLAESVAKWFPRVKRQIYKISKTPNSPGPIYKWVPKVY